MRKILSIAVLAVTVAAAPSEAQVCRGVPTAPQVLALTGTKFVADKATDFAPGLRYERETGVLTRREGGDVVALEYTFGPSYKSKRLEAANPMLGQLSLPSTHVISASYTAEIRPDALPVSTCLVAGVTHVRYGAVDATTEAVMGEFHNETMYPVAVSLGKDFDVAGLTVSPFAAPTVVLERHEGAFEKDYLTEIGAGFLKGRYSVRAAYYLTETKNGDNLVNDNSLAVSFGVAF